MALCQKYRIPHSQFLDWAPEDKGKALAFAIEEAERCSMCGTAGWEWADNKYAYEPQAQLCKGCYLKDTAQEDSKNLPGTTVVLVPSSAISPEDRERRLELERRARAEELEELRRR